MFAVRKIKLKEYFHYVDNQTFSSSSTSKLISSSADNWTVTYDSEDGGFITAPSSSLELFLTNVTALTVDNQVECSNTC